MKPPHRKLHSSSPKHSHRRPHTQPQSRAGPQQRSYPSTTLDLTERTPTENLKKSLAYAGVEVFVEVESDGGDDGDLDAAEDKVRRRRWGAGLWG